MARAAMAKLEKDLAEAKVWNEGIVQKKQEQANCQVAAKKKKEDEAAVEVQWKADKATKKKVSVQPLVSSFACLLQQSKTNLVSSLGQLSHPKMQQWGRPNAR